MTHAPARLRPPALDPATVAEDNTTGYPPPYRPVVAGRFRRRLGEALGLEDFGVNLTRLEPGAATALPHWHSAEDEFVYILEGEVVLVTEAGEQRLGPGMCAGFPKGRPEAHCLVNRSDRPALLLEVGTRRPEQDEVVYPGVDLRALPGRRFAHADGRPWEDGEEA